MPYTTFDPNYHRPAPRFESAFAFKLEFAKRLDHDVKYQDTIAGILRQNAAKGTHRDNLHIAGGRSKSENRWVNLTDECESITRRIARVLDELCHRNHAGNWIPPFPV